MGDMADYINEEHGEQEEIQHETKSLHTFYVAGVQFHKLKDVIGSLKVNDELCLEADPDNKFDPNAVAIKYESPLTESIPADMIANPIRTMLGFVPKGIAPEIAVALSIGRNLKCIIVELNPMSKPWEKLKVEIIEVI